MTIDWNKPIQYKDGSPATLLPGRSVNGYRKVTPKGEPNRDSGNHYCENGAHSYAYYDDIVNVPEPVKPPTDQELADELRAVSKRECELFDILQARGYTIRNGYGERLGSSPVSKISKTVTNEVNV
jgi:hypothetical protein